MSEIKILHLSDLHYDSSSPQDTQIILDALWEDLKNFPGIDFIVFSGDLVKAGDKKDEFEKASRVFIDPLLEKTNLSENDFFITPGNHDIQMSKIDEIIEEGLKSKLKDRESVNEFLDRQIDEGFKHIERLENFNDFKTRFKTPYTVTSNKLFTTYSIQRKNIKIGIACLNTCWRATGAPDDGDRGKLLIGERQIDAALTDIKNCDIKIALYHHPLDCLTEYDQGDAERWLSKEFDFLFCGHIHSSNIRSVQHFENKTILDQGGSLNNGRSYYNGYSVLCFDVQESIGTIYLRSYFDDRGAFDKAINKCSEGKISINLKKNGDSLEYLGTAGGSSNMKLRIVQVGKNARVAQKIEHELDGILAQMDGFIYQNKLRKKLQDYEKEELDHTHHKDREDSIDGARQQVNQLYRHTKVDFPKKCSLDQEIELSVQLTIEKSLETVVAQLVSIPMLDSKEPIKLTLQVTAPGFHIDNSRKTMIVPANDVSEKVIFKMKPLSAGNQLVEVEIYFNALRIGYFGLEIQVEEASYDQS